MIKRWELYYCDERKVSNLSNEQVLYGDGTFVEYSDVEPYIDFVKAFNKWKDAMDNRMDSITEQKYSSLYNEMTRARARIDE